MLFWFLQAKIWESKNFTCPVHRLTFCCWYFHLTCAAAVPGEYPRWKLCHKEANEVPLKQPTVVLQLAAGWQQTRPVLCHVKCMARSQGRNFPASEILHPILIRSKDTNGKWLLIFLSYVQYCKVGIQLKPAFLREE